MRSGRIAALLICGALAAAVVHAGDATGVEPKAAFERLKALAGEWHGTGEGKMANTVSYRTTAGGHAVMETMMAGTPYEMVSVYYMDGSDLVMTHYCGSGNQPHLRLDRAASRPDHLAFAFDGGTNLDPAKDEHIHAAWIGIGADGKLEEHWSGWKAGKPGEEVVLLLNRTP